MTNLPKPTIIERSQWEKEWFSIRMPTITKDEFMKEKHKQWYRYQWYKRQQ